MGHFKIGIIPDHLARVTCKTLESRVFHNNIRIMHTIKHSKLNVFVHVRTLFHLSLFMSWDLPWYGPYCMAHGPWSIFWLLNLSRDGQQSEKSPTKFNMLDHWCSNSLIIRLYFHFWVPFLVFFWPRDSWNHLISNLFICVKDPDVLWENGFLILYSFKGFQNGDG